MKLSLLVALGVVLVSSTRSNADELLAIDTGWYSSNGSHFPSSPNYLVGFDDGIEYHNFSVFDMSSITQPIQSATVLLFNGSSPPNTGDGYGSPDPFENYALNHVSTDIGTLTDGTGGLAAFNDLADGIFYGSVDVSSADNGAFVAVELNAAGIAALNSADGLFAFGGNITTLSGGSNEFVFGSSQQSPDVRLLVETIPEPSSTALLGVCLIGAWMRRRR